MNKINIFWFRRDLRLEDNTGLYYSLNQGIEVLPVFIFDRNILSKLTDFSDKRVEFIYKAVEELKEKTEQHQSSLHVFYDHPEKVFEFLAGNYSVHAVYVNTDYESYAKERDRKVKKILQKNGIEFIEYKDQVIFEKDDILKDDGTPYTVYTPYMKKWKNSIATFEIPVFPSEMKLRYLKKGKPYHMPDPKSLGYQFKGTVFPNKEIDNRLIRDYHKYRDYPFLDRTTHLGVHLRFGTISIRELIKKAGKLNEIYLNEMVWREFFMMIIWHFPDSEAHSFKKKFDFLKWRNNEKEFELWCKGETGYAMVDAGMKQLNETGYMHNRVRMITAGFLTKHLLIDWRWGEAYFAEKLLDYELSSNVGNWQWAASTGCDAVPYFRFFNPDRQMEKFDPEKEYIKKWIPGFDPRGTYMKRIVEHIDARERMLNIFKTLKDI